MAPMSTAPGIHRLSPFVELDRLTRHRSQNFGLEKNRPFGDGVVTGRGTVSGPAPQAPYIQVWNDRSAIGSTVPASPRCDA